MFQRLYVLALINFVLLTVSSVAWAASPIDPILQAKSAPPGVVFEIVTGKNDSLDWALPQVKSYIDQIHQRFPDIHIAVVTHGREMFALAKRQQSETNSPVHQLSKELVQDGVSLHVCGTYAERKGLNAEDFPEYVNVAAEGPAQVKDYRSMGYVLVKITRPATK
ncbi:MAG: hypothetical protein GC149_15340 [Gammaproteobacteria bacterium]|nr:hypothetical protein [Gammaproteobacteria bacterium]